MSKNVFGYIRVSGLGQVDKDGPLRQRDAIISFAEKHGMSLDPRHIYEEKAVSGTVEGMERPAFTAMLARIEELRGRDIAVDGFVCERLDRLARDLMCSEFLLAECRNRKLQVFAVDQGDLRDQASDGDDPTRVLIRQILGALSQWQKCELVKKMRLARERIKKETGRCEGKKPFGSKPGEAPCLEAIKTMHAQGNTDEAIARELNAVGFRNRSGALWSRQSIRKQIKHKKL